MEIRAYIMMYKRKHKNNFIEINYAIVMDYETELKRNMDDCLK